MRVGAVVAAQRQADAADDGEDGPKLKHCGHLVEGTHPSTSLTGVASHRYPCGRSVSAGRHRPSPLGLLPVRETERREQLPQPLAVLGTRPVLAALPASDCLLGHVQPLRYLPLCET